MKPTNIPSIAAGCGEYKDRVEDYCASIISKCPDRIGHFRRRGMMEPMVKGDKLVHYLIANKLAIDATVFSSRVCVEDMMKHSPGRISTVEGFAGYPAWHLCRRDNTWKEYACYTTQAQPIKPSMKRTIAKDKPPCERIDIFGRQFPESAESDWKFFEGAGWVHTSSAPAFHDIYDECSVTKRWVDRNRMVTMIDKDGIRTRLSVKGAKSMKLERCSLSDYYTKPEDTVKYRSQNYELLSANVHYANNCGELSTDFVTGELFVRSARITIRDGTTNRVVHRVNYEKLVAENRVHHCNNCGNNYIVLAGQESTVANRPDLEGIHSGPVCNSCHETILTRHAIRAYNDSSYPPPIVGKRSCLRVVGGKTELATTEPMRLFGVEVELQVKDRGNMAKHAITINKIVGRDFAIIKHDGSIRDPDGNSTGFEIVSAPADLDTHRRRWPALEQCPNYGQLVAWDPLPGQQFSPCGLHVHVTRAALNELQIGRILSFVNHPANKRFVEICAGRSEQKYTKYYPKKLADAIRPSPGGNRDEKRRVAVNLTNEKTIEFRIFRGTVNVAHIIRDIEWCDAVCSYCWPSARSLRDMASAAKFVEFVLAEHELNPWFDPKDPKSKASRLRWPELVRWFTMHGVGKPAKAKKVDGKPEAAPSVPEAGESPLESIRRPSKATHSIGISEAPAAPKPAPAPKPEKAKVALATAIAPCPW